MKTEPEKRFHERLESILENLADYYLEGAGAVSHEKYTIAKVAVYELFGVTEDEYLDYLEKKIDEKRKEPTATDLLEKAMRDYLNKVGKGEQRR